MSSTCGPTVIAPPASLGATVGASFVGTMLASVLYGVTSIQTITFFWNYRQDARWLKRTVLFLWVLDTIHLAFIGHAVYTYLITDFGNTEAVKKPVWSITAHVLLSNLSDAAVRAVFLYRIWTIKMDGYYNLVVVSSIGIFSLMVLASGCAFSIWGFTSLNYVGKHKELSVFLYINLVSGMISDLLIAASFCWNLQRQRSSIRRSNLDYLMICSISIGLLTSICTLLAVLLYALLPFPSKFAFVAVYFILPKLLLNSLLVTLNIRKPLFRAGTTSELSGYTDKGLTMMSHPRPWYSAIFRCICRCQQTASHPLVVKVDISVEQDMVAEDAKSVVNTDPVLDEEESGGGSPTPAP